MKLHEEGDRCPTIGCNKFIEYCQVENCSCHIAPPCSACVGNPLQCRGCGWTDESEPEDEAPPSEGRIKFREWL